MALFGFFLIYLIILLKNQDFFKKSKIFRFIWKKDQRNGKKSVHLTSKKELVNKEAWPNEEPSAWEAFGMKVFWPGVGP